METNNSKLEAQNSKLLLFDGECNLCNGWVQWVLPRDRKAVFRFAALQSEVGRAQLRRFGLSPDKLDTVVLIMDEQIFTRSDAVLELVQALGGPWRAAVVLKIFPRFLRDAVYDFVARNRYRWFGKRAECWLPTPELRARFL